MDAKSFGMWGLLALLWGSAFLAIGIGVDSMSPVMLVAGRMTIGALLLVAFLYMRGSTLDLGRRGWIIAAVVGTTGNVVPFVLISAAEQHVDSGLAALIMGVSPIVTMLVAPMIHPDERLGPSQIFGALLGFGGIVAIVGPEAFRGLGADLLAQVALIGAALCYSLTALISRRFPHREPMQMAAASVLFGAILIDLILLPELAGGPLAMPTPEALLAVLYLGAGPTGLAAIFYFLLIPRIGASRLQQVNYVVPVIGVLLGILVLNERPGWNVLIALPLTALAIYFVSRKPKLAAVTTEPA